MACFFLLSAALCPVEGAKSKRKHPAPAKPAATADPKSSPLPAEPTPAADASDWQVIKIGPRDYLSVDNIARFYSLAASVAGKTIHLDNSRSHLELTYESREASVNGVRNWLCFPVLEKDGKFLISRIDLAKTVEPQLRPHMIANLGKVQTVVLDPGHGGFDKGATNSYGFEKDYALDVARQLRPLLQAKGFKVIMTRENDVFLPLELRAHIANGTQDSVFVSLHFNATDTNPTATGFEVFSLTPRGAPSTADNSLAAQFVNMQAGSPVDAQSAELSVSVYHAMVGQLQEFDRGVKRARFAVLRHTKIPAILVEGGFVSEKGESKLIANPAWRGKLAEAIATGIENYRTLADKKQRPMTVAEYRAKPMQTAPSVSSPPTQLSLLDLTQPRAHLESTSPTAGSPTSNSSPSPTPSASLTPGPEVEP